MSGRAGGQGEVRFTEKGALRRGREWEGWGKQGAFRAPYEGLRYERFPFAANDDVF